MACNREAGDPIPKDIYDFKIENDRVVTEINEQIRRAFGGRTFRESYNIIDLPVDKEACFVIWRDENFGVVSEGYWAWLNRECQQTVFKYYGDHFYIRAENERDSETGKLLPSARAILGWTTGARSNIDFRDRFKQ
jgi:hypothetical protein